MTFWKMLKKLVCGDILFGNVIDVDKCKLRTDLRRGVVQIELKDDIIFTDRTSNERVPVNGWVDLIDVGPMWIVFEARHPDKPDITKMVGSGHSPDTARTFFHMQGMIRDYQYKVKSEHKPF